MEKVKDPVGSFPSKSDAEIDAGPKDARNAHDFTDLDNEISRYETGNLLTMSKTTRDEHIFIRLFRTIKDRFGKRDLKESSLTGGSEEGTTLITCRICEQKVAATDLERHTEWCSKHQFVILRATWCLNNLRDIESNLLECKDSKGIRMLLENCKTALDIDIFQGKSASVRLAKLQYKIAKKDSNGLDAERAQDLKRIDFLVLEVVVRHWHDNLSRRKR